MSVCLRVRALETSDLAFRLLTLTDMLIGTIERFDGIVARLDVLGVYRTLVHLLTLAMRGGNQIVDYNTGIMWTSLFHRQLGQF